jgi:hypothetical protein
MTTPRAVEILWMGRRKPVNGTTEILILARVWAEVPRPTAFAGRIRTLLRLIVAVRQLRSLLQSSHPFQPTVSLCRFEHAIAGRTYVIEVSAVSATRWRAQLARLPGMPTSVMPFYGGTPEDAAKALTNWLSLVSAPAPLSIPRDIRP